MQSPVQQYREALAEVHAYAGMITERLEAIAPTEAHIHWGHVGSVKHVLTQLKAMAEELGIE